MPFKLHSANEIFLARTHNLAHRHEKSIFIAMNVEKHQLCVVPKYAVKCVQRATTQNKRSIPSFKRGKLLQCCYLLSKRKAEREQENSKSIESLKTKEKTMNKKLNGQK